jgi:hypothetical protein
MPADRGADLAALEAVAANRSVLDYLAPHSGLKNAASASIWDLDAYVLHSHPDLTVRLEEVGSGRSGVGRPVGLYGYAALVDARSVVRAVVMGNVGFVLRIADPAVRDEVAARSRFHWASFGEDWVGADPWPRELTRDAGTAVVRDWVERAFASDVSHGPDETVPSNGSRGA